MTILLAYQLYVSPTEFDRHALMTTNDKTEKEINYCQTATALIANDEKSKYHSQNLCKVYKVSS